MVLSLADIQSAGFYTVEELAPLLRVSERTLRRYCTEGIFKNATKIRGKNWLIPGCDVLAICRHLQPAALGLPLTSRRTVPPRA